MSKNFENEYIALTQVEVPDLWERIEAGLNPKSTQGPEKVEASVIDLKEKVDFQNNADSNNKVTRNDEIKAMKSRSNNGREEDANAPKGVVYFVKKYKTVLAAAVCIIVILPAAVMLGRMGSGMGGFKSASADTAVAETECSVVTEAATEETVAMEAAEEEEMAAAGEAMEAAEEYAMYEDAAEGTENGVELPAEAVEDASADEQPEVAEESASGTEKKETKSTMDGVVTEAAEKERAAAIDKLDVEDGTVLTRVTVRVYAKEEVSPEGESKGMGNLYRAEVLEDADGLLAQGDEILIYISPLSSTYLPDEEEIYDVMLEYDSTREYPFRLKSCY